jgi:hypothetical protein
MSQRTEDVHFLRSPETIVVSSDHHTFLRPALQQLRRFEVHGGIGLLQTQEFAREQHVKAETGGLGHVKLMACFAVG